MTKLWAAAVLCAAAASVSHAASVPSAAPAPTLEAAFDQGVRALKASPVVQTRQFYLESWGGPWRVWGGTGWPDGELQLDVEQGQHVRLDFALLPGRSRNPFPEAMFDVDGLDAVVDGRPEKGIHVWLRMPPERVVVEFDAVKDGMYPIYQRWGRGGWIGRIVIWKKRVKKAAKP